MKRIRNRGGGSFIPEWLYPATVLLFWLVAAIWTVGQLLTVKPALKAIPAPPPPVRRAAA